MTAGSAIDHVSKYELLNEKGAHVPAELTRADRTKMKRTKSKVLKGVTNRECILQTETDMLFVNI